MSISSYCNDFYLEANYHKTVAQDSFWKHYEHLSDAFDSFPAAVKSTYEPVAHLISALRGVVHLMCELVLFLPSLVVNPKDDNFKIRSAIADEVTGIVVNLGNILMALVGLVTHSAVTLCHVEKHEGSSLAI